MYFRNLPSLRCLPRALPVPLHLPLSVSASAPLRVLFLSVPCCYLVPFEGFLHSFLLAGGFSHTTPPSDASWLSCHHHSMLTPSTQRQHQSPQVKGSSLRDCPLLQLSIKSSGCHLCFWSTQRSEVPDIPRNQKHFVHQITRSQCWAPLSFAVGLYSHVGQNGSPRLPAPLLATLTPVWDPTPRALENVSPLDHTPSGCCPASSSEMGRMSQPHLSLQDWSSSLTGLHQTVPEGNRGASGNGFWGEFEGGIPFTGVINASQTFLLPY